MEAGGGSCRFSILTPVYRPDAGHLEQTIRSVMEQTRGGWELILIDDASASDAVDRVLSLAEIDPRVTVIRRHVNGGIVAASNDGLAAAQGQWLVLLDHDDLLDPVALEAIQDAIGENPHAVMVYSDRDNLARDGTRVLTFDKPDWSPERLRGNMYAAHLTVFRTDRVRDVGGFRDGYDGSQDHDLALRVTEAGGDVVHVAQVLYHWRMSASSTAAGGDAKPYAREAGLRAVRDHIGRVGIDASVEHVEGYPGFYRVRRRPPAEVSASLIIPTRGSVGQAFGLDRCYVVELARSIMLLPQQTRFEVVVVADATDDLSYLDSLQQILGDRLKVVHFDKPFNFSEKVNVGALHSQGDVLVFMNDDMEVVTSDWLDQLVALAWEKEVGAAGALLRFDDGLIQHGGHHCAGGAVGHAYYGTGSREGHWGDLLIDHEVVGVTAALLATRRDVWWEVGGFTETLPLNYNDVDFCWKIRSRGYRIIFTPHVEALHFESRTRVPGILEEEKAKLNRRWVHQLVRDPYAVH